VTYGSWLSSLNSFSSLRISLKAESQAATGDQLPTPLKSHLKLPQFRVVMRSTRSTVIIQRVVISALSYAPTAEIDSPYQFMKSDAFEVLKRSVIHTSTSLLAAQCHPCPMSRCGNRCSTVHISYRYDDCLFCSKSGHHYAHCPDANRYIQLGRCKRNARNHINSPNGIMVTSSVGAGRNQKERIDNWHRANDPRLVSTRIAFQKPVAHASPILATSHFRTHS